MRPVCSGDESKQEEEGEKDRVDRTLYPWPTLSTL